MKRIFGRVLVKETNSGIPNLVVAAFDSDRLAHAPVAGLLPAGPGTTAIAAAAASAVPLLDQLGRRLGSVLTDADGNFAFDTEREDAPGSDAHPDLVLVVFAPEDSRALDLPAPLPPGDRVLHISWIARNDAGPVEAYIIRLLQSQLERYAIPWQRSVPGTMDSASELERFISSIESGARLQDQVKQRLSAGVAARVAEAQALRAEARTKVGQLSAIPHALRTHPYLARTREAVADVHSQAMQAGLDRLVEYRGRLQLDLTPDDLASLGLHRDGVLVTGRADPGVLARRMAEHTGTDLVRARGLVPDCVPAATGTPHVVPADKPTRRELMSVEARQTEVLDKVSAQLGDVATNGAGDPQRPDQDDIRDELRTLQISGGPADAVAFHDFHVLQMAFEHVWTQAFDLHLKDNAEQAFAAAVKVCRDAGIAAPDRAAIEDIEQLRAFLAGLRGEMADGGLAHHMMPTEVQGAFADLVPNLQGAWNALSDEQRVAVQQQAMAFYYSILNFSGQRAAREAALVIFKHPAGPAGRLERLLFELGTALTEPYAFDVFAPDTYNFGVMLTYRQRWVPESYQAGDLVATIPLAPNESRKYSKRRVVKSSRAEKSSEKSSVTRSMQSSEIARAESEIMKKASTATNFKMVADGTFKFGFGDIHASSTFTLDQKQESASNKKDFHEATVKAAEEYRQERSLEVDTTTSEELEETSSGEISNPNNELTVTYLFYELQRRYRVSEQIHRARPVILVAQEVPAPHQIDEAWLIANQWIIAKVLLDDMFRPALAYLASGLAGDEITLAIARSQFESQRKLVDSLESHLREKLSARDVLRASVVATGMQKAAFKAAEMPLGVKIFGGWMVPDPMEINGQLTEAAEGAARSTLEMTETDLGEVQKKLREVSDALAQATKAYSAAIQESFARRVAVDQLRLHVKQNILYYMQAIWASEVADQRFFRLYQKPVVSPEPVNCTVTPETHTLDTPFTLGDGTTVRVGFTEMCGPNLNNKSVTLEEIADLDSPLGFKGNYMIFPLKRPLYLTSFMLREFVDEYFGIRDPDEAGDYSIEDLVAYVECVMTHPEIPETRKQALRDLVARRLSEPRPASDTIIVPTGQLFIEALPGTHPLLEDFKLRHRREDLRKAQADVRHAELENLRLAARLVAGELEDPDVEKRIVVDKGALVTTEGT